MRYVLLVLSMVSLVSAGDRKPVMVTVRPVFVATVHCITVRGVDYDLEPILAEYRVEWTWPGGTEQTLREHLREEHGVTGIESLTDRDIRKLHAVLHERAKKAVSHSAIRASPAPRQSSCPGGVCPVPNRSRGLFFKWR